MEAEEPRLDDCIQKFQSAFNQAVPEEKMRLASQASDWAQELANSVGIPTPKNHVGGVPEDHNAAVGRRDTISQNMQSLVESEIHLRQMAEHLEQVVWVRDLHTGRFLYVSPAYETVWGRSCESLYANPDGFIESVHPEDRLQVMVSRPHDDSILTNQEYRIVRPDGSLRWIFARFFLIHEASEPAYRLVSFAQDITGQKEVDLALRTALDRTREQFNLSHKMSLARKPEAVLRTLMSARELRSAHQADLVFFEYPEYDPTRGLELVASWQSSDSLSAWLGESSLYDEHTLWGLLQRNRPVIFTEIRSDPRLASEVRELLLKGKIHSLAIFPLVASGVWLGCLLFFYNQEHRFDPIELRHLKVLVNQAAITLYNLQLLEAEEDLRREAERANQIKTQFLAMISHELRTPLTSIVGFTTTLLAEDVAWEPDEQRDFIQTIQKEADRLQELINHLLDLSRL
jgi:PAS domain S-box-containing protein